MEPTLRSGVTVVLDETASLERGELAVVRAWDGAEFVVRVVGLGGDQVTCCEEGRILVNGVSVDEPYAHGDNEAYGRFDVSVPHGRVFVLGDARSISVDSRSHLDVDGGTLPVDEVRGQIVAVASPIWRIRPLVGPQDIPLLFIGVPLTVGGLLTLVVAVYPLVRHTAVAARSRLRLARRQRQAA